MGPKRGEGGDTKSSGASQEVERLRKSLVSIGAEKDQVESLMSSKALDRIVIPIYWKDGMVVHPRNIRLMSLPELIKRFEEEFPDGQIRWDPDYESNDPKAGDTAIRVYFSYQEDDQGISPSPPPNTIEEESYQRILDKAAFKGQGAVTASTILHAS